MTYVDAELWYLLLISSPVTASMLIASGFLNRGQPSENRSFLVERVFSFVFLVAVIAILSMFAYRWHTTGLYEWSPSTKLWPFPIFIDYVSAVLLALAALLYNIIVYYSDRYMHREVGYHRYYFFLNLLFLGFSILVTAGSLELLFGGWEIIAIASFMMIGFYRSRDRSGDHAIRALLTYRVCDVGLLIGAIVAHHLGSDAKHHLFAGMTLISLNQADLNDSAHLAVGALLLIAASGKSAQFPFSGWLPRAFEGPSNSSAIFYGALSIHAGVFLLIRTQSLWFGNDLMRVMLALFGIISFVYATMVGRVQSNIKAQIAWAASAQVALMFIEVACGLFDVALLHMLCHSSLRCFQLLISSSALIMEHRYHLKFRAPPAPRSRRLFIAALHEFYLDFYLLRFARYFRHPKFPDVIGPTTAVSLSIGMSLTAACLVLTPVRQMGESYDQFAGLLLVSALLLTFVSLWSRSVPFSFFVFTQAALLLYAGSAFVLAPDSLANAYLALIVGIGSGFAVILSVLRLISDRIELRPIKGSYYFGIGETFPLLSSLLLFGFLAAVTFPVTAAFRSEDILLEAAFGLHHGFTVLGAASAFLLQLVVVVVVLRLYFGENRAPGLSSRIDTSANRVALAFVAISLVYVGSFFVI